MKLVKIKKVIIIITTILFVNIFIISGKTVIDDYYEYKEVSKENNELIEIAVQNNDKAEEKSINWESLKSINKDIVGWIEIENTIINYPILKDDSSLYYLNHSYNKKYSNAGSIFTINNNPFEDYETCIYGHNMKNGTMFSMLGNYLDEEFFYSHLDIKIYTPYGNYKGKIFSAYSIGIETESNNIKNMNFKEIEETTTTETTYLYESICTLIIFIFLYAKRNKRKYEGELTYWYFFLYGIARAIIEGFRTDSLMLGNMRISQILSIILSVIFGSILLYKKVKK